MTRAPIGPARGGGVTLRLPDEVRRTLAEMARQLGELYGSDEAADDPAVARLFPTAYLEDPMANIEFDSSMGDGLREGRLEAIAVVERTADAPRLTDEEASAWLTTLNDARLVLGTRLGVTEESDEGDFDEDERTAATYQTYLMLSAVVDMLVEAMSP
ncbi:MAG: DUF2017 family protein [Actinomycetota bacterium]